jgi:heme exporter protein C
MSIVSIVRSKYLATFLIISSAVSVLLANYYTFMLVPNEAWMGPVQRIFYFHLGAAMATYLAVAVLFAASILYLSQRDQIYDLLINAAAEVALVMCSIVMLTGMIWGHSAWNTWFRFEPRLVSFLILWLILFSIPILRIFGDRSRMAAHSAVFGILAAINVPIVIYSVKILTRASQLHPEVVSNRGVLDPLMRQALVVSIPAVILMALLMILLRARIGLLESRNG